MGSAIKFVRQRLVPLAYAFLFYVSTYLLPVFTFILAFIFRLHKNESFVEKNGEEIDFLEAETELSSECIAEKDVSEFTGLDGDCGEEKEEVFLKFRFPTFEEFVRIHEKTDALSNSEVLCFRRTSKYDLTSGKESARAFVNELETFPVEKINGNRKCELGESGQDYNEISVCNGEGNDDTEAEELVEKSEKKVRSDQEDGKFEGNKALLDEPQCVSEKNSMFNGSGSGSDSIGVDDTPSAMNHSVDSHNNGFLSDEDFGLESMQESSSGLEENMESSKDLHGVEEMDTTEVPDKSTEHDDLHDPHEFNADFLSEEDFTNSGFFPNYEETESKDSAMPDSANELDSFWEHQDLIDQLKVELRKVKDAGLPTILEESESPKIMEDLKPLKIDEKLRRGDGMGELHKFYKSYRERMRKLDILNYQKMYAMGLLQLKDSLQPTTNKKSSAAPSLKSLVSQNLWLSKHKSQGSDPMKKFITELEGDVEVVYVGQMCASWEMLYWQYEKALDLWDSDARGVYRYNEVAGEFQQFQVLMQRFVEDEPFQGPRLQNYAKTRCVLRNLLQVPVIRVDNMKDKKWRAWTKDSDEYVVTIEMLVEIIEESIRIFWRFVKADKDCTCTPPTTTHNKIVPQLYDPEDLSLLLAVLKTLQEKERKLKDMLRSKNCVLRRFRRCRQDGEDEWDQVLSFFSQIDMRLVSRVLRMSKITRDQLIWCHDKLNRISFVNRKMCVEPGFLLFPC